NRRYVVRVKNGSRIGTIFGTAEGWYYQFDGTPKEGPRCRGPEEALGIMEAVADHLAATGAELRSRVAKLRDATNGQSAALKKAAPGTKFRARGHSARRFTPSPAP